MAGDGFGRRGAGVIRRGAARDGRQVIGAAGAVDTCGSVVGGGELREGPYLRIQYRGCMRSLTDVRRRPKAVEKGVWKG